MKPDSNQGAVCGNLVLSKLCSIFQAFLVVLQTSCSDLKPADSRLAFLTPPFRTLLPQLCADQGLETTFGPSVPHHMMQHHPEAQHVGKQGRGHGAAPPTLPASMPNTRGKQNKKLFWTSHIFAFALSPPRPSLPVIGSKAAMVHTEGVNCPRLTFWMGGFGCSCWGVHQRSKHSQYATAKCHQSLALSP